MKGERFARGEKKRKGQRSVTVVSCCVVGRVCFDSRHAGWTS